MCVGQVAWKKLDDDDDDDNNTEYIEKISDCFVCVS